MLIKVGTQQRVGADLIVTHSAEVIVDSEEEAEQQGDQFAKLCWSFNNGYGSAQVGE